MQRSATFIDVFPVGRCVQNFRLYSALPEQFRRFGGGRSMGAVDQYSQAAQVGFYITREPIDIFPAQFCLARQARVRIHRIRGSWALELSKDFLLYFRLPRVGEFIAVTG